MMLLLLVLTDIGFNCSCKEKNFVLDNIRCGGSLIIAWFCLPPLGIIDNSVLIAVGELGFFGVIAELPSYLESKK